jgi:GTPase
MHTQDPSARPPAVLAAVQLPDVSDAEHEASLAELERLVHTLGYRVAGVVSQRRDALAPGAVLGEGKLKELAAFTGGGGIVPSAAPARKTKAHARLHPEAPGEDPGGAQPARAVLVAVDHEITPSQARNLERATSAQVLDRTGVIVEIFHRHAQSREARLQVEIARLTYLAPRLRETSRGGDRQRGGVGGKGAGESALELDRRKIRDRIAELRADLAAVQREQDTRRARRRDARRVALVGYTNAGKSSLMRALTGSEVLVADKLFATLDTTVRALAPEARPRILVSDTVGFIKKLPHDLVASFRSTLDEALEASLLLYVVDASDTTFRDQLAVTREVLGEIGAAEGPSLLLLNKVDRLGPGAREALEREFPDARLLSAYRPEDVSALRAAIVEHFERDAVEAEIVVPYGRRGVVGEIHDRARVLDEAYDDASARFRVRAHPDTIARLRSLAGG